MTWNLDHWQPGAVHLVEHMPQGAGGTLENAVVGDVKLIAFGLEQAPGVLGLFDAQGGQIDVGPAGKAVVKIPGGFAVADENEFVHGVVGAQTRAKRRANTLLAPSF